MPVAVDVIGIGAGVVDRLDELDYEIIPVNVAHAAKNRDGDTLKDAAGLLEFVNLRSYVWWHLRDRLNPDGDEPLALPLDDRLTGDLCAPHYTYTSDGKIKVESKDDIRKRLKRSTDGGDAVCLAVYVDVYNTTTGTSDGMIQAFAIGQSLGFWSSDNAGLDTALDPDGNWWSAAGGKFRRKS